ncbi:MAG: fatty acid desaturase [Alphaproteobacteria bacterium]|nr:fatty acid desaturase [Alphaproteobacteria bacterium]
MRRKQSARRLIPNRSLPNRGPGLWIMLAFMSSTAGLLAAWAGGVLSYALYLPLQSLSMFMIIEMGHEAVHGAVHPNRRVNDLVGHTSATLFASSYRMHRRAHKAHHVAPMGENDGEQIVIPGRGSSGLRWAVEVVFNAVFHLAKLRFVSLRDHPTERPVLLAGLAVQLGLFLIWPEPFALGWFLPAHFAMFLFWLIAAELPHDLLGISAAPKHTRVPPIVLQWLTYFHEEHHLRPAYPFFQWPGLYRRRVETMQRLAPEQRSFVTRELRLLPIERTH